jgi:hypothetical protein
MVSGNPWIFNHLEHDTMYPGTWYYVHCWSYGCCGGTCCHPLYCIPSTFIMLLIFTEDVTVNIAVKCIVMKCLYWVGSDSPWRKCTWWYGVLGESMSLVHGDIESWERACQLYMVIERDGREHVSCTWWYRVLGESMSVLHGDTEHVSCTCKQTVFIYLSPIFYSTGTNWTKKYKIFSYRIF